jgi:hypothetical protein
VSTWRRLTFLTPKLNRRSGRNSATTTHISLTHLFLRLILSPSPCLHQSYFYFSREEILSALPLG